MRKQPTNPPTIDKTLVEQNLPLTCGDTVSSEITTAKIARNLVDLIFEVAKEDASKERLQIRFENQVVLFPTKWGAVSSKS